MSETPAHTFEVTASRATRLALWLVAFMLAAYLGRATIIDGEALSLMWPAAGVAALWFVTGSRRTWALDALALGLATVAINMTTGAPLQLALVFVAANLLQAAVFVLLFRRLLLVVSAADQDLDPLPGMDRLSDLGALVCAAVTSAMAAALVGWTGLWWVVGSADIQSLVAWWGRNSVAVIVITTLGLIARPRLGELRRRLRHPSSLRELTGMPPARQAELALHALLGAAVTTFVFLLSDPGPLAFILLFTTVLIGVRFGPLVVGVHGLLLAGASVGLTLAGQGPFAAIEDLHWRTLVAQIFVALTSVTGLVLALHRREREALLAQLQVSQKAAAERAQLLDAVLENMHEGVAVVDADDKILLRNNAGRQMLGLGGTPGSRAQPLETYRLHRADGTPITPADLPYVRALAAHDVVREDLLLRPRDDGPTKTLEMNARPLPAVADGDLPRAIVTYRDVTADRADRDSLASFAGVVAHDLLTPVTVIAAWSELLAEALDVEEVDVMKGRACLVRITGAADRMRQLIDDLLTYTITRDGSFELVDVDLSGVAGDVAQSYAESNSKPVIHVQPGLHVLGDHLLVRQVLDNLIGNAVKYVAPGVGPAVSVAGEEREGWLHVTVTDNGIGVPEEHRRRIFENFQRAHAEDYRGTGLGLAICQRAVERHGGTITVAERLEGQGSVFEFTLPAASAPPSVTTPGPRRDSSADAGPPAPRSPPPAE